jgi:hypothetical protein
MLTNPLLFRFLQQKPQIRKAASIKKITEEGEIEGPGRTAKERREG